MPTTSDDASDIDRPAVLDRLRMPARVLDSLACTHCGAALGPVGNALRCEQGHAFDVAREGYANLITGHGSAGTGDSAAMVAARFRFQQAGHYAPLSERVAAVAADTIGTAVPGDGLVADLGAGTGHYLAGVLDARPDTVGLAADVSRYALRRAAKAHPRAGAVGCDVWRRLPLRDGAASLLLNVFAPRNAAEFHRVLHPGGRLLVVTPTARHLAELRAPLGLIEVDPRKDDRIAHGLAEHFTAGAPDQVRIPLALDAEAALAVVSMGPSAHHIEPDVLGERVAALAEAARPIRVTASFQVRAYRPR